MNRRRRLPILLLPCCLAVARAATAHPSPATLPAAVTTPTTAPADWLDRAVRESEAPRKPDAGPRLPSPADLVALARFQAGDVAGFRGALAAFAARAAAEPDPASRAARFATLASGWLRVNDRAGYMACLEAATAAASRVEGAYVRAALDAELAQLRATAGDFPGAEQIIRGIGEPAVKGTLYCALALLATSRDDDGAMTEYLRMARRLTKGQEDDVTSAILLRVGRVEARAGYSSAARATADTIPLPAVRVRLYATLAQRQRRAGNASGYHDALERGAAECIRLDGAERVGALVRLAYLRVALDDRMGAKESARVAAAAAEAVCEPEQQFPAFLHVADAYARLGDAAGCRRYLARAQLARGIMSVGSTRLADPPSRLCAQVAASLARANRYADAADVARRWAPDDQDLAGVHWAITEAQANADLVDDARESLRKVSAPLYRIWACRRIGEAYGKLRGFDGLTAWVDSFESPDERAWACLGAAEGIVGKRAIDTANVELFQLGLE